MPKVQQSTEELEMHLCEQLDFLRSSAVAYDIGRHHEAKRIATTLRLLLHETSSGSHALLGQLGRRDSLGLIDASRPDSPSNVMAFAALVLVPVGLACPRRFIPLLDAAPSTFVAPFLEWWSRPIIRSLDGHEFTRKTLVLAVANQDGGAHVDPGLGEAYHAVSRGVGTGIRVKSPLIETFEVNGEPFNGLVEASIRHIGHEVLKSLDSRYVKQPTLPVGVQNFMLVPEVLLGSSRSGRRLTRDDLRFLYDGRAKGDPGALCACGSNERFDRCHGDPVRPPP